MIAALVFCPQLLRPSAVRVTDTMPANSAAWSLNLIGRIIFSRCQGKEF